MAKFYAKTLEQLGLDVTLEYVEENRPNFVAKLPGEGKGPNLMFCGHLDTVPLGKCVSPKIDVISHYYDESLISSCTELEQRS